MILMTNLRISGGTPCFKAISILFPIFPSDLLICLRYHRYLIGGLGLHAAPLFHDFLRCDGVIARPGRLRCLRHRYGDPELPELRVLAPTEPRFLGDLESKQRSKCIIQPGCSFKHIQWRKAHRTKGCEGREELESIGKMERAQIWGSLHRQPGSFVVRCGQGHMVLCCRVCNNLDRASSDSAWDVTQAQGFSGLVNLWLSFMVLASCYLGFD